MFSQYVQHLVSRGGPLYFENTHAGDIIAPGKTDVLCCGTAPAPCCYTSGDNTSNTASDHMYYLYTTGHDDCPLILKRIAICNQVLFINSVMTSLRSCGKYYTHTLIIIKYQIYSGKPIAVSINVNDKIILNLYHLVSQSIKDSYSIIADVYAPNKLTS